MLNSILLFQLMMDIMEHFADTDYIACVLPTINTLTCMVLDRNRSYNGRTTWCDTQAYSIYAWPWTLRDFHTFFS